MREKPAAVSGAPRSDTNTKGDSTRPFAWKNKNRVPSKCPPPALLGRPHFEHTMSSLVKPTHS